MITHQSICCERDEKELNLADYHLIRFRWLFSFVSEASTHVLHNLEETLIICCFYFILFDHGKQTNEMILMLFTC